MVLSVGSARFAALTTCNSAGWLEHGRRMVETFDRFWPSDVSFHLYAEDFEPDHPRPVVRPLPAWLDEFKSRHAANSRAHPLASTEFTYSRFLTPLLADFQGWALFCDCDFLWLADVAELLAFTDPDKAVLCVQHDYRPTETTKMDGRVQTLYPPEELVLADAVQLRPHCRSPADRGRRKHPDRCISAPPAMGLRPTCGRATRGMELARRMEPTPCGGDT